MKPIDPLLQEKQRLRAMKLCQKLFRFWTRRDGYAVNSKRWNKWDRRANRRIARISKKLIKYQLYSPDWFMRLYHHYLQDKQ